MDLLDSSFAHDQLLAFDPLISPGVVSQHRETPIKNSFHVGVKSQYEQDSVPDTPFTAAFKTLPSVKNSSLAPRSSGVQSESLIDLMAPTPKAAISRPKMHSGSPNISRIGPSTFHWPVMSTVKTTSPLKYTVEESYSFEHRTNLVFKPERETNHSSPSGRVARISSPRSAKALTEKGGAGSHLHRELGRRSIPRSTLSPIRLDGMTADVSSVSFSVDSAGDFSLIANEAGSFLLGDVTVDSANLTVIGEDEENQSVEPEESQDLDILLRELGDSRIEHNSDSVLAASTIRQKLSRGPRTLSGSSVHTILPAELTHSTRNTSQQKVTQSPRILRAEMISGAARADAVLSSPQSRSSPAFTLQTARHPLQRAILSSEERGTPGKAPSLRLEHLHRISRQSPALSERSGNGTDSSDDLHLEHLWRADDIVTGPITEQRPPPSMIRSEPTMTMELNQPRVQSPRGPAMGRTPNRVGSMSLTDPNPKHAAIVVEQPSMQVNPSPALQDSPLAIVARAEMATERLRRKLEVLNLKKLDVSASTNRPSHSDVPNIPHDVGARRSLEYSGLTTASNVLDTPKRVRPASSQLNFSPPPTQRRDRFHSPMQVATTINEGNSVVFGGSTPASSRRKSILESMSSNALDAGSSPSKAIPVTPRRPRLSLVPSSVGRGGTPASARRETTKERLERAREERERREQLRSPEKPVQTSSEALSRMRQGTSSTRIAPAAAITTSRVAKLSTGSSESQIKPRVTVAPVRPISTVSSIPSAVVRIGVSNTGVPRPPSLAEALKNKPGSLSKVRSKFTPSVPAPRTVSVPPNSRRSAEISRHIARAGAPSSGSASLAPTRTSRQLASPAKVRTVIASTRVPNLAKPKQPLSVASVTGIQIPGHRQPLKAVQVSDEVAPVRRLPSISKTYRGI